MIQKKKMCVRMSCWQAEVLVLWGGSIHPTASLQATHVCRSPLLHSSSVVYCSVVYCSVTLQKTAITGRIFWLESKFLTPVHCHTPGTVLYFYKYPISTTSILYRNTASVIRWTSPLSNLQRGPIREKPKMLQCQMPPKCPNSKQAKTVLTICARCSSPVQSCTIPCYPKGIQLPKESCTRSMGTPHTTHRASMHIQRKLVPPKGSQPFHRNVSPPTARLQTRSCS